MKPNIKISKTFLFAVSVAVLIVVALVGGNLFHPGGREAVDVRYDPNVDESESTNQTSDQDQEFTGSDNTQTQQPHSLPVSDNSPPTDLALPFAIEDFAGKGQDFASPFGIIRKAADQGIGHGGLDIPLVKGDEIFAPGSGEILSVEFAPDRRGGDDVVVLLKQSSFTGEGWIFIFEHITLNQDLGVGSKVKRGEQIGVSAIVTRSNNHMQLTYAFNNYLYYRDSRCWVDHLESVDRQAFGAVFESGKAELALGWSTASEEGFYPYKGLLDPEKYPDGPRPCYPMGTDARIPL